MYDLKIYKQGIRKLVENQGKKTMYSLIGQCCKAVL